MNPHKEKISYTPLQELSLFFPFSSLYYLVIPLLFYQMLVELILLILEWFACLFYELDQRWVSKTNRCYDISYVIFYKNYY